MTLTEFLLARIAEDEAAARAATPGPWGHDPEKEWHDDPVMLARARNHKLTYDGEEFVRAGVDICIAVTGPADDGQSMADAGHIARHDPARVLAECEAKRRIVARASRSVVTVTSKRPSPFGNLSFSEGRYFSADGRDVTDEFDAWHAVDGEPEDPATLRDLATIYADHSDYDEAWRP